MNYNIPTYAVFPTFLGVRNDNPNSDVCVAGASFDLATSNRPGARLGPAAIRAASRMLYDGQHPRHWLNPLEILNLADVGDFHLPLGQLEKGLDAIAAQAKAYKHLVTLGGDHSITYALLQALTTSHEPLGLIHFDAHTDAWPTCFDEPLGHGAVFRRVLEAGLVDPKRMVQIGIRAKVDRDVYDWLLEQGVTVIWADEVHQTTPEAIAKLVKDIVGTKPCYLSCDIDCLDPSQAPGTGSPEIGGLFTWQLVNMMRAFTDIDFVGMDVVEVAPPYDHAEITALAAATIAYEYISLLAVKKRNGG